MGNLNEVYKAILKEEGLTQTKAAELVGYASQGTLSRLLCYGISLDVLSDLTDKLEGYTLVLEKRTPKGRVKTRYELQRYGKGGIKGEKK